MDDVFRALADPTRRLLLDRLRAEDGQTLTALEQQLSMTRFGVMKHLKVLEEAHLVTTRKLGREKFHYLNPVPIQQVADRWMSRYAAPFAQTLIDIKTTAEGRTKAMTATKPVQVYEIFIRGTAEDIFDAIINGDRTPLYYYGTSLQGEWKPGGKMVYRDAGGHDMIVGEVLEVQRPYRLVTTFAAKWQPDFAGDKPTRVTWEITEQGDTCKLTLVHDRFEGETATYTAVAGGWSRILSGLKTLIETGKPLSQAA